MHIRCQMTKFLHTYTNNTYNTYLSLYESIRKKESVNLCHLFVALIVKQN